MLLMYTRSSASESLAAARDVGHRLGHAVTGKLHARPAAWAVDAPEAVDEHRIGDRQRAARAAGGRAAAAAAAASAGASRAGRTSRYCSPRARASSRASAASGCSSSPPPSMNHAAAAARGRGAGARRGRTDLRGAETADDQRRPTGEDAGHNTNQGEASAHLDRRDPTPFGKVRCQPRREKRRRSAGSADSAKLDALAKPSHPGGRCPLQPFCSPCWDRPAPSPRSARRPSLRPGVLPEDALAATSASRSSSQTGRDYSACSLPSRIPARRATRPGSTPRPSANASGCRTPITRSWPPGSPHRASR